MEEAFLACKIEGRRGKAAFFFPVDKNDTVHDMCIVYPRMR